MRKKLQKAGFLLIFISLFLTACGKSRQSLQLCGDGICSDQENPTNCPADCALPTELPPTETIQPSPTEEIDPLGYLTFAVYVSDFVNHVQSAETVMALVDLFENAGVVGEFYLTGPIVDSFTQFHPEVIERLTESGMTISYHVQPPHPLVPGFQSPIQGLPVDETKRKIMRYESEELDPATGALVSGEPGGYAYLTELFGSPPVAVDTPKTDRSGFALPIFEALGAKVVVLSTGSEKPPLTWQYGMIVRPADLTLNRWNVEGVDSTFPWWDMLESEHADKYQPLDRLMTQVDEWDGKRLPFILVPISEHRFYREGSVPWIQIYYSGGDRTNPNSPPFDLNAPDASSPRPLEQQQAIWSAYTELVQWSAKYMQVITSADLASLQSQLE